jgi:hypothetical protein
MARDHRIRDPQGAPVSYTCENHGFRTNTSAGKPHGPLGTALGNVLSTPLIQGPDYSLWLEHVVETKTGRRCYWLMWYDSRGVPSIPISAVFERSDLSEMLRRLAEFVP